MNCGEFEILLADYIDGALPASERDEFVRHLETCPSCAALANDARAALAFMDRAAEIEPPPALVTKILHATNAGWELKLRSRGFSGWINRAFAPVLRPRMVLGALMTLMSLTMLSQCGGPTKTTMTAADLDPVRLWNSLEFRANRVWDRAVKGYESMRLVYEVKSQIDDWAEQQREAGDAAADAQANSRQLAPSKTQEGK